MTAQENLKVIRSNVEAWNAKNAAAFRQLRTDDFAVEMSGVSDPLSAEQLWAFWQGYLAAFSEAKIEVTLTVAQGDYVVAHWIATGVHTMPFRTSAGKSIPATGKKVAVKGCSTYELKDGKISQQWDFADLLSLARQLGLATPI